MRWTWLVHTRTDGVATSPTIQCRPWTLGQIGANTGRMTQSRRSAALPLTALLLALVAAPTAMAGQAPTPRQATRADLGRTCGDLPVTILGTPRDDVIRGTEGRDVIAARDGDDRIVALGGDDVICPGRDDDHVTYSSGLVYAGDGNDLVSIRSPRTGTAARLLLDLGRGRDELEVLTENVPAGFEWFGYTGRDLLRTAPIGGSTSVYDLSLGHRGGFNAPYSGFLGGFDDYIGTTSTGAQLVVGSGKPNVITVSGRDSRVQGRGGDDTLRGRGPDTGADGGDGTDTCVGFAITANCEK